MRDPTGDGKIYNKDWKYNDAKWTTALKATVPYGLDPTQSANYDKGIFAVPLEMWLDGSCFAYAYIAHVRKYSDRTLALGNYAVTKFDFDQYDEGNDSAGNARKWYNRFGQADA